MVKGLKQRLTAAALSAVMAFTAGAVTNGMPAYAAAKKPYVSLRTAYKTLKVNETNKMTLKNNTIGWKITKVATEDRTVAMVYKKTASSFMVKGKAAGKTTVKARLKTTSRKKYNSKLVKCTVNVLPGGQTTPAVPDVPKVPVLETKKSVATQAELQAALADSGLTEITIDTKEKTSLIIPQGDHSATALIVKAPQAHIENNARFKSIDVQQIAGDTWQENASGNTLRISATSARIIVGAGGQIRDITFTGAQANAKLVVNGTVENVTVSAKMSLDISSDLDKKPIVPVRMDAGAQGADITAQTPLDVTVKAVDAVLNFKNGSEGSKVKAEVKATVNNDSKASIEVKDAKDRVQKIYAGGHGVVNETVTSYVPSTSNGSGGGSSSQTPSVTYYTVSFNGKQVRVRAGDTLKESDIPESWPRNGDGFKFSGWYYADGEDEEGNVRLVKFDLSSPITRNIELVERWGMTEEDRVLDIKGNIFVTSGSAITVDLSRSRAIVAILDGEMKAVFVKLNDTAVTVTEGLVEANARDGKLEIIIQTAAQAAVNARRYRTEISMPAGAENGISINLAECVWEYYAGKSVTVSSQEELNAALSDRSYNSVTVKTEGALHLKIDSMDRSDMQLGINAPNAVIENHAVFGRVFLQDENCAWTEYAKGSEIHVLYHSSSVTVAEGAEAKMIVFNWGGEGNLTVNGAVSQINLWNDKKPEDTKKTNVTISGTSAANIPLFIYRQESTVAAKIPLDVTISDTAPGCVVNFEAGAANSTISAYVEAEVNNHSGGEIVVKETK